MSNRFNDSTYWRAFGENDITHSAGHYLMAIDALRDEYGYARVTDVAETLEISRSAASMAISQLKRRGWVSEDRNRFLLLTEDGAEMARLVEGNFAILSKFFEEVLGAEPDVAKADACKMEHLMSLETGRRLVWLMRHVLNDSSRAADIQKVMTRFARDKEPEDPAGPDADKGSN
ncbi:MAG: metal-dependent transcriptional regulator [Candidatus Hydrogenedentes bacterium]|nr:metal-dependent transcriptional regulator [Candidatus Hydrogenedentota bacterium]